MDQFSHDPLADDAAATDAAANRNDSRDSLLLAAQFRVAGQQNRAIRIRNLSAGGLMAEIADALALGTAVEVDVRGLGWIPGRVAWVAAGRIGVAFDRPIDPLAARKPVVTAKPSTVFKPIKPILK
jgi:hypothetical protein